MKPKKKPLENDPEIHKLMKACMANKELVCVSFKFVYAGSHGAAVSMTHGGYGRKKK